MMKLTYQTLSFAELSNEQLYRIMQVRQEVFVVEQDCPYLDADDRDQGSLHVLGTNEHGQIHAYCRLCPQGMSYTEYVSIGRVITSAMCRGQGEGVRLMEYAIAKMEELFPGISIKISAQTYILKFYQSLGFQAVGDEYLEDGIPHRAMIR